MTTKINLIQSTLQANNILVGDINVESSLLTTGSYANSAYTQANTATTNSATADQRAVTSGSYANSAYSKANTALIHAQAAYAAANTGGGSADLSAVSEDILPAFSEVYDIGSANNRWYDVYVSNKLNIDGADILGSVDGVVIPTAALVDQLLISDNMITPDDTSVRQYFGDKGVVAINGNLDVDGDWLGAPVVQTIAAIPAEQAGDIDTSFVVGSGFNNDITKIKKLSNGKILVSGKFSSYNGTAAYRIARLNSDGTLDTTFNRGGFDVYGDVYDFDVQSDGKIVAVGDFVSYDGTSISRIARLNSDGSLDSSFDPGVSFNHPVLIQLNTVIVQSDGKIVVGGKFNTYQGSSQTNLIRLNADGTRDTSIGSTDGQIYGMALQSDGKILVSGPNLTTYNGSSVNKIFRLNSNGTIDNTFSINNISVFSISSAYAIEFAIQPDGKILLVSSSGFTGYNKVVRLNSDGSLDNSFNILMTEDFTFATGAVYSIALQSDGKFLLGGAYTAFNANEALRIARFNGDGTLDTEFQSGLPPGNMNNAIETIEILDDGDILIGGSINLPLTKLYGATVAAQAAVDIPSGGEEGFIRYNKDITAFQAYNGTTWELLERVTTPPTDLATTGTVDIDFSGATLSKQGALTGDITYTGSNYLPGSSVTIRVVNGSTQRTLTFPTNWVFVGGEPTTIAASKTAILTVTSFGTTEADCVASWAIQS